jgi:hypothetical protein
MQIFRTGHDVRAYARNHDGVSLGDQRAEDTELVRNLIRDFSGNTLFLERVGTTIVYLHRKLNFKTDSAELSASGLAVELAGTGDPSPDNEQLERMSAALIRLCTRRHATFDRIFHSESHLPRHIAEIRRDLADMVSAAHSRSETERHGDSSDELFSAPLESYVSFPMMYYEDSPFPASDYRTLQNKEAFVSQAANRTERDEVSLQWERANPSMDHMILDAINDGLATMGELIISVGRDEIGKRQIIDSFYSEIYGKERDKIAPKINDRGKRNEYLREIGSIARNAGLTMTKDKPDGITAPKPKALGANVFQTVVTKSYHYLRSGDLGAKINEMEPEIRRRIQEEGLRLVAPMARELGYPDAAAFRSELRAIASDYGVAPDSAHQ